MPIFTPTIFKNPFWKIMRISKSDLHLNCSEMLLKLIFWLAVLLN